MSAINEALVEEATLTWLERLGYRVHSETYGGGRSFPPERESYAEVAFTDILRAALHRIDPDSTPDAIDEAIRQVLTASGPSLIQANRGFHSLLANGVAVDVLRDGEVRGERVQLIDFDHPERNDFRVINQFTVIDHKERRPDVVVFVNGIPLAIIELKNLADEQATIEKAWNQFQTYQQDLPTFFTYNAIEVVSDGVQARMGGITTPFERAMAWKTVDGYELVPETANQLETLIKGVFEKRRFLDLIRSFIVFEDDGQTVVKKIAGYHQYHAVNKAIERAVEASAPNGDHKGGVVWHTQGSGKSLTMLFFAGKLILEPAMANPTIVMLTDRNDLDGQLFLTFSRGSGLLRQTPAQAESREDLRELLTRASGGVIFTTIQKFEPNELKNPEPLLSDRRNIIVMADEAHRSHYDFTDGYAVAIRAALPNATFVAFTGTPLELGDKDTRIVFGDYIDIYDVEQAVRDGATVPIYYESRQVPLDLPDDKANLLDDAFEELTEREETEGKARLASKWSQLEALVGTPKRTKQVAADLVEHFERRQEAMMGKGLIVTMSRRIAVELYDEIVALRPGWQSDDDASGKIKVVMTGSASDPLTWQPHIRNKKAREAIAQRFKNPDDELQLVIVRDMWLTGFDVPPLHTMYVDKPMRGHGLMQAIARVNRVFRDKPGGLVVDYLGIGNDLKKALQTYTQSGGKGRAVRNVEQETNELVAVMLEKLDVCRSLFDGFDYVDFLKGAPTEILQIVPKAREYLILRDYRESGYRKRFDDAATALLKAFALAGATDEAQRVRREVAFFQTVKAAETKTRAGSSATDIDHAVQQLVDRAIAPQGVVDIFAAAGLDKPDISILSESFLLDVEGMPQKNLAVELLQRLLNDEINSRKVTRMVQARLFSDRLSESLNRYNNRSIETAQIIEELIDIAREMRAAEETARNLGLNTDELAFYDALSESKSAVDVLGDEQLRVIAREVADTVRNKASIDWTKREQVRADLRRHVKRVLRKHGYPPDKTDRAAETVIEQAELLARSAA